MEKKHKNEEIMNEEIYESDDNKFLDYIFYQFKDIKVKNLHTLQQKNQNTRSTLF